MRWTVLDRWRGRSLRVAVALALCGGCVGTAHAAPARAQDAENGAEATTPSDGLAETPFVAKVLGLSLRVPAGTSVRTESGPTVSYLLSEAAEQPAWRMRLSSLTASKAGTTPASQCADYLAELRAKDQSLEVLADEPRTVAGSPAHLLYLGVPLPSGGRGITGVLIVEDGPDAFIVFSILAIDGEFARVRPLLDRSIATARRVDTAKAVEEQAVLLSRGAALTAAFDEKALRAAAGAPMQAYRMWKPDATGAKQDYGYFIVQSREGMRGEVDASRDPRSLKDDERDTGLFVTVDARVVLNDDPTHTLDVQSRYFMTFDRASEAWSMRSTERHKRAMRSSAQTGIRNAPSAGAPRAKLSVIVASRDGMTREPVEILLPPVYISQAELFVLGELMPKPAGAQPLEFMDYAFDQKDARLPLRRETWSPTNDGWRLETRIGSAPAPLVQEFDAKGRRVRRVDPDGTVSERIALEDLRALWKSKGLPVD
ncbi:MAG: hypothetical protein ACKOYN_02870 [Planctomycetota bacterium]